MDLLGNQPAPRVERDTGVFERQGEPVGVDLDDEDAVAVVVEHPGQALEHDVVVVHEGY